MRSVNVKLLAVAAAALAAQRAQAANTVDAFTGAAGTVSAPQSGDWNTATDWSPSAVPTGSTTLTLQFNGSGSSNYGSQDDLAGAFSLNQLLVNTSAGALVTLNASSPANYLAFAGTSPLVTITGAGSSTLALNMSGAAALTVSGTANLTIIANQSYSGTTTLNGGELNYSGNASAGVSTTTGNLIVGAAGGSRSIATINTTGSLYFDAIELGVTGNSGVLVQNSGTLTSSGVMYNALNPNGFGAYVMNGGVYNSLSVFRVGSGGGSATAVFVQTGGIINMSSYWDGNYTAGSGGASQSTITGGTFNASGAVYIDDTASTSPAFLNLGTLLGGTGLFVASSASGVQITSNRFTTSASVSTLNIDSGTLQLKAGTIQALFEASLNTTVGTATLNLDGGTIQAAAANLSLISPANGLVGRVYNGGAIFDTQSYNANVSANLVAVPGNGIYKASIVATPTGIAGAGYEAAPAVLVSGGSGSGAQAVANINSSGNISGFTLVNPGQNYLAGDTLTFTLLGGGAATAAAPYSYTLQATDLASNANGGLTKKGSGTLTLTGANTYTGATQINAGTINLGSAEGTGFGPLGNGGAISFGGGTLQYTSVNQNDYSSRFSTIANQAFNIDTNGQNVTFAGSLNSSGGSLTKIGAGTLTLTAAGLYTGSTNISAGSLVLGPNSGLSGTAVTVAGAATFAVQPPAAGMSIGTGAGSLTVNSGGILDLTDGVAGTLNIVNTAGTNALTLGTPGGTPALLRFDLTPAGTDQIVVTGNAVVASSATLYINASGGSLTNGSYPLITAGAFNGTNFSLVNQFAQSGNSDYSLSLSNNGTQELLNVQQVAGLANAYWAGSIDGNWETDNAGMTNFRTDASGSTDSGMLPGPITNVFFSTNGGSAHQSITLTSNETVNSLNFVGDSSPITISGSTLTLNAAALNGNTLGNGINVSSSVTVPVTINSNVSFGSTQTWTNNASTPLTINGSISNLNAAPLTLAGSGSITLGGSNTLTGGLIATSGTLNVNNSAALGGLLTIAGPVTLDNTTGSPLTLNSNPQQWNSNFSFNGSNDLNLGGGQITLGANATVTINNGNLSTGGTVTDGGAGYTLGTSGPGTLNVTGNLAGTLGLTVNGPGTVDLTGANTTAGPITVSGGTLAFGGATSASGANLLTVGAANGGGLVTINTSGILNLSIPMVGGSSNTSGSVVQTAGIVNYLSANNFNYLFVGGQRANTGSPPNTVNDYGSYTLAGGSLLAGASTGVQVGNNGGYGVFLQSGGTLTINRALYIGNGFVSNQPGTPSAGFVTFTGGTTSITAGFIAIGSAALGGDLNIGTEAGGSSNITLGSGVSISIYGNANLSTFVDLNAGVLTFTNQGIVNTGSGGSAAVNLNGITIQNSATVTNLLDKSLGNSSGGVYVYNGGVNFNTAAGTTATVSANLQGAAGDGVYKNSAFTATPTGATGGGYIGAPLVAVAGGSGTGAQAIATVDTTPGDANYGQITGFTMTNPGQGYQLGDTLTLYPIDGGAATLADPYQYTLTAADIAPNNLGGLNKTGLGTLLLSGTNSYAGPTNVLAGTLVIGASGALPAGNNVTVGLGATLVAFSQATISSTSALNINGNLIVHNGSIQSLTTAIATGYNNGNWNGAGGIVSTAAASDTAYLHALGVIQNDDGTGTGHALYTAFEGQSVSDSDVLVKFTCYGDANLDGKVDGTDYSRIDSGYLADQSAPGSATGWFNGDFNYDGIINGSDYTLIDNAYNTQGAQISAQVATSTAEVAGGSAGASVPEPTLGLLGLALAGMLGRRARRPI